MSVIPSVELTVMASREEAADAGGLLPHPEQTMIPTLSTEALEQHAIRPMDLPSDDTRTKSSQNSTVRERSMMVFESRESVFGLHDSLPTLCGQF